MQNLYLSNSIGKNNDLSFFSKFNSEYPEIIAGNVRLRFFYTKGNESIYKTGDSFLANLGVFIYKNEFNKKALQLFFHDLQKGLSLTELLLSDDTRGQFCLILYDINNDSELKIITDRLGYFPLYCYFSGNIVEISNSFMALARNNKASLNYQGIAEYLSENVRGHACCDKNIVSEINFLEGGSVYTLRERGMAHERYYNLKDDLKIARYDSFDEVVRFAEDILTENLSFLKKVEGTVYSDITGGFDTRLNLVNLLHSNIKLHYGVQLPAEYDHYTNIGKYSELKIVKQISQVSGIDVELFNESDYWSKKEFIDDIAFNMSNKLTYNRRTGYFLRLKEKKDVNLIVSGISGTELLRQPCITYFNKHKMMHMDEFLRGYYPLVNVMKDDLLKEETYYDNLKDYFGRHLDGLEYEKVEDVGAYIDYFAFYRTHFCKYLALANSVTPFYTPYGDFRFAKIMYETAFKVKEKFRIQRKIMAKRLPEAASINTTRGFPGTIVTHSNFYKFIHMISRNIPQQYFSLKRRINDRVSLALLRFLFKHEKSYNALNSILKIKGEQNSKLNLEHRREIEIIPVLKKTLRMDLPVFRIVDKDKLKNQVRKDCNFNILNRVLLLNRILMEIKQ